MTGHRKRKKYNCAKVYEGNYVGGGTNEFERYISCGYSVLDGEVTVKELKPTVVIGTNSEGTKFRLKTLILYPKTDFAVVRIFGKYGSYPLKLYKVKSSYSRMFRQRL